MSEQNKQDGHWDPPVTISKTMHVENSSASEKDISRHIHAHAGCGLVSAASLDNPGSAQHATRVIRPASSCLFPRQISCLHTTLEIYLHTLRHLLPTLENYCSPLPRSKCLKCLRAFLAVASHKLESTCLRSRCKDLVFFSFLLYM